MDADYFRLPRKVGGSPAPAADKLVRNVFMRNFSRGVSLCKKPQRRQKVQLQQKPSADQAE